MIFQIFLIFPKIVAKTVSLVGEVNKKYVNRILKIIIILSAKQLLIIKKLLMVKYKIKLMKNKKEFMLKISLITAFNHSIYKDLF